MFDDPAEHAHFDASQYAFFGKDVTEEIELGGLYENECTPFTGFDENEFMFSSIGEREEVSFCIENEIYAKFACLLQYRCKFSLQSFLTSGIHFLNVFENCSLLSFHINKFLSDSQILVILSYNHFFCYVDDCVTVQV